MTIIYQYVAMQLAVALPIECALSYTKSLTVIDTHCVVSLPFKVCVT